MNLIQECNRLKEERYYLGYKLTDKQLEVIAYNDKENITFEFGGRQTGKTTVVIMKAIKLATEQSDTHVMINSSNSNSSKYLKEKLWDMLLENGLGHLVHRTSGDIHFTNNSKISFDYGCTYLRGNRPSDYALIDDYTYSTNTVEMINRFCNVIHANTVIYVC